MSSSVADKSFGLAPIHLRYRCSFEQQYCLSTYPVVVLSPLAYRLSLITNPDKYADVSITATVVIKNKNWDFDINFSKRRIFTQEGYVGEIICKTEIVDQEMETRIHESLKRNFNYIHSITDQLGRALAFVGSRVKELVSTVLPSYKE